MPYSRKSTFFFIQSACYRKLHQRYAGGCVLQHFPSWKLEQFLCCCCFFLIIIIYSWFFYFFKFIFPFFVVVFFLFCLFFVGFFFFCALNFLPLCIYKSLKEEGGGGGRRNQTKTNQRRDVWEVVALNTKKSAFKKKKIKVTNPKSTRIISYWINDRLFFFFFHFKKGKRRVGKGGNWTKPEG